MEKEKEFTAAMNEYKDTFGEYYPLMLRCEGVNETINNIRKCINKGKRIEELEPIEDGAIY